METTSTVDLQQVAREANLPLAKVEATLQLLDDGNTVPFITRYRKDHTGGLDEEQVRRIQLIVERVRAIADRRQRILKSLETQDKLTEDLARHLQAADSLRRLEDLYLPYKPKKQTLADIARGRGLEPLTRQVLTADESVRDLQQAAGAYVREEVGLLTADDVIQGVRHLIAETFAEDLDLRDMLREQMARTGKLSSLKLEEPAESSGEAADEGEFSADSGDEDADDEELHDPEHEFAEGAAAGEHGEEHADNPHAVGSGGGEKPCDAGGAPDLAASEFAGEDLPEVSGEVAAEGTTLPAALESPPPAPAAESGESQAVAAEQGGQSANAAVAAGSAVPSVESSGLSGTSAAADAGVGSGVRPSLEAVAEIASVGEAEDGSRDAAVGSVAAAGKGEETAVVEEQPAEAEGRSSETDEAARALQQGPLADRTKSVKRSTPKLDLRRLAAQSRKEAKQRKRQKKVESFKDYFRYQEPVASIPPHRLLAINRGERSKILRVKIEVDTDAMYRAAEAFLFRSDHPHVELLRVCLRDAMARLILPSLEREVRRELTERAELHAVRVFARNLRKLLLQPPVRDRRVLAIDPGFRSGCKLAALDEFGSVLGHTVIHVIGKDEIVARGRQQVVEMIVMYHIPVIAIGNGTGCRETERLIADLLAKELQEHDVQYVIVNEAGASVYSTSPLGREELPKFDPVLRSAVSIGRRLQDPLSELVKIDPANIGVGLYQHDVKGKHLEDSLDAVVKSCVNFVGVDINTASPSLLKHVSGLNQLTARRLFDHRQKHGPFRARQQFLDVPGVGESTYVQAAGFLKITGGENPLDATWIHPESYEAAKLVIEKLGGRVDELARSVPPRPIPGHRAARGDSFGAGVVSPPAGHALITAPPSDEVREAEEAAPPQGEPTAAHESGMPAAEDSLPAPADALGAPAELSLAAEVLPAFQTSTSAEGQAPAALASGSQEPEPAEEAPASQPKTGAPPAEPSADRAAAMQPGADTVHESPPDSTGRPDEAPVSPPADGAPADSAPADSAPADSAPADGAPADDGSTVAIAPASNGAGPSLAERAGKASPAEMARELGVGELLLQDILRSLTRPGRDPREDLPPLAFRREIMKLEHLQPGMELSGTVLNVVDFGAFVDIGLPDSGLIHISRLADRFVRDPHEVVSVGDIVNVWVVDVDRQRRRVSLTAIRPGTEKPAEDRGPRHEGGQRESRGGRQQGRPPRREGRPQGKPVETSDRGKTYRPPKPKAAPPPPLTEGMVEGTEPMRSFSDLMQFFTKKKGDDPKKKQG